MSDDEMQIPPVVPEPDEQPTAAREPAPAPEQHAPGAADDLPIPLIPRADPRLALDRRRLQHRRKHFTLYVLRSARRRQNLRVSTRQRLILFTFISLFALIVGSIATTAGIAYGYYQSQAPALAALNHSVLNSDSVRIYDMHGILLYQLNNNGVKHSIPFAQIPKNVLDATVAIEDKGFWTNDGIDPQRILSAAIDDYTKGHVNQGASTITQQLIKNTLLDSQVTVDRKLREAVLAYALTKSGQYSKQDIITMYLNTIAYGPYIYSIDSAAHVYFGYSDDPKTGISAAHHMDLAQSSFLAGIPQNPVGNNPLSADGYARALIRQQDVLQAMVTQTYITPAQAEAATKASHGLNFIHTPPDEENKAPHFVEYVKQQLAAMVDTGQLDLSRSGLSVYTTLDLPLQDKTQQIIKDHLFGTDTDDYGGGLIRNDNVSNGGAVLIEQKTGALRVLLGSFDYYATKSPTGKRVDGKFDVMTTGYRQPGSTFKALVYSTAFNMGWYPAMTINDVPTVFPLDGSGKPYKPLDAEREKFYGEMTLRKALQFSMDIPAIKTLQFVGVDNLLNTMARMGVSYNKADSPGLASAIGALEVHPIDMVQAYATFANYGRRVPVNAIDHIVDGEGNTIYQYSAPRGTQVFSPQVSYLLTSVLTDNASRAGERGVFGFGLCSPLLLYPEYVNDRKCSEGNWQNSGYYPVASKTGTTDNLADDWTMGYTMNYTGGVWVGNQKVTDGMYHIDGITGAAPIWHNMMVAAELEGGKPPTPFPVPSGVVRAQFSSNGYTTTDWFLAGNVPSQQGVGNGGGRPCINVNNNDGTWNYCSASSTPQPTPVPGG